MAIYTADGVYLFSQSVTKGAEEGHCFSAMGWLGSLESGTLIIATVSCEIIAISGLHLTLLRDSLQKEDTVTLLAERENMGYCKYDFSAYFAKILCFLAVVAVSSIHG